MDYRALWIRRASLAFVTTWVTACGDDSASSATDTTATSATTSETSETSSTGSTGSTGSTMMSTGTTMPTTGTMTMPTTTGTMTTTDPTKTTGTTTTTGITTTGTTDPACEEGVILCEEEGAVVCEGGVFSEPVPCGELCVEELGCVVCEPGAQACDGDEALVCDDDGQGWGIKEVCDGVQGVFCNEDFGGCDGPCASENLQLDYLGCDYYPTVTMQLDGWNGGTKVFGVTVANTADVPTDVLVTRGDQVVAEVEVAANSVKMISLPWVSDLTKGTGPSALTKAGAYRLRANNPVTVYQFSPIFADTTNDASLLLPVNAWSGELMVAAAPHWVSKQNPNVKLPGFYAVVASEDGTTVTLQPSKSGKKVQAGGGVAADGTGVVMLNAGDVLQVLSDVGGDLTGTRVSADRPIQVIAGHKCTNVPANVDSCDHLEEAMVPLVALAKSYIVAPPVQSPNDKLEKAQVVRVIASEDDTTLVFTPDQGAKTKISKAGDYVELQPSAASYRVSADKKIMVAQYMVGQAGGYGDSDPAMLLTVAVDQYRDAYLFHAPPTWSSNYVDVVAPDGAMVEVDGNAVDGFTKIGGTGFGIAHVKLNNDGDGNHTVSASAKVGIAVYGVQSFGSYWTAGGLDLEHF